LPFWGDTIDVSEFDIKVKLSRSCVLQYSRGDKTPNRSWVNFENRVDLIKVGLDGNLLLFEKTTLSLVNSLFLRRLDFNSHSDSRSEYPTLDLSREQLAKNLDIVKEALERVLSGKEKSVMGLN